MFRFLSVNSMEILASRSESGNYSNMAGIRVDQTNNDVWYWDMSAGFPLKIVVIK